MNKLSNNLLGSPVALEAPLVTKTRTQHTLNTLFTRPCFILVPKLKSWINTGHIYMPFPWPAKPCQQFPRPSPLLLLDVKNVPPRTLNLHLTGAPTGLCTVHKWTLPSRMPQLVPGNWATQFFSTGILHAAWKPKVVTVFTISHVNQKCNKQVTHSQITLIIQLLLQVSAFSAIFRDIFQHYRKMFKTTTYSDYSTINMS
jgi:hypothetical protein